MNHYDVIRARFEPKRTDNLKPEALWWVGREMTVRAAWIIEGGDYKGDWAMLLERGQPGEDEHNFGWVPLCDLTVIEVLQKFPVVDSGS